MLSRPMTRPCRPGRPDNPPAPYPYATGGMAAAYLQIISSGDLADSSFTKSLHASARFSDQRCSIINASIMKNTWTSIAVLLCVLITCGSVIAQTPTSAPARSASTEIGITPTLALGEVTMIDAANNQMKLKTKDGDIIVHLSANTVYKRVAPGETDLKNATVVTLADIGVGDRVIAMGRVADDRQSVPARQVIVMTKADIAKKQEREREEWRRRGVAGRVLKLDPQEQEIVIAVRTRGGEQQVTITNTEQASFRRYAPDSVKFSDAKPSSFAEMKIGDQVRVLGQRSEDGTRLTPEIIVFGSFRLVGGMIKKVDPTRNEIVIDDLQSGKPLTVVVNADSLLRRIPTEIAAMIARFRAQQAGGGSGNDMPTSGRESTRPTPPGGPPGGVPGRMGDLDEMLERLPALSLAELKPQEMIVVSGTEGVDAGRVTAIKLLAGVEALLMQPSGRPAMGPSFTLPGLDAIGLP